MWFLLGLVSGSSPFLPRDAMKARPMPSCGVCVCVCVCRYVCPSFVHSVKTNKDIFEIFSPSGSHSILVYQTAWRESPLTGASNAGGVGRNRDYEPISGILASLPAVVRLQQARCCQHGRRWTTATVPPQVVTHRW